MCVDHGSPPGSPGDRRGWPRMRTRGLASEPPKRLLVDARSPLWYMLIQQLLGPMLICLRHALPCGKTGDERQEGPGVMSVEVFQVDQGFLVGTVRGRGRHAPVHEHGAQRAGPGCLAGSERDLIHRPQLRLDEVERQCWQQRRVRCGSSGTGRCLWGSTAVAGRWCSR
jgi:hypothetical protein